MKVTRLADVTASYTGKAAGISVRDKTSGHFTANVDLTATFGASPMLGGTISGFDGKAANPEWNVMLADTAIADGSSETGVAYGGTVAGAWTAQGYGPAPVSRGSWSSVTSGGLLRPVQRELLGRRSRRGLRDTECGVVTSKGVRDPVCWEGRPCAALPLFWKPCLRNSTNATRRRNPDDPDTHPEACCARRWAEQLRGHDRTAGERLERDRAVLQRLCAIACDACDACDKRPGRVSSLSLVRYRGTDYSVPTRFGHCEVLVRGHVHEVVISCAAEVIARHPRSYGQEDFVFDPLHCLSLPEQKTNALDQAAPLASWLLPPVFGDLRRLPEARMGKAGKREDVQVLRLIESFSPDDVRAAISEALERGVIGFDAVKHLVLCRIEKRPPRLNLLAHPYLPRAGVATPSARSYMGLLKGAAP